MIRGATEGGVARPSSASLFMGMSRFRGGSPTNTEGKTTKSQKRKRPNEKSVSHPSLIFVDVQSLTDELRFTTETCDLMSSPVVT